MNDTTSTRRIGSSSTDDATRSAGEEAAARTAANWFRGRRAVLGTKHGKEAVIAPLLATALEIETVVPETFDTDRFGTFTRDVPRAGSQLEAARAKAMAAMDLLGFDLGIASEGSFGPHPAVPFVQADIEIVVLVDRATGLELHGHHVTTDVRSLHAWVSTEDEAVAFALDADFPRHGVIVRRGPDDPTGICKDIATEADLRQAVRATLHATAGQRVFLESDLRAHRNPTRMEAIRAATADLIANAQRACPACGAPGFHLAEVRPGLPCAWCGSPTRRTLAHRYACTRCSHHLDVPYPDGQEHADPGSCPVCNP